MESMGQIFPPAARGDVMAQDERRPLLEIELSKESGSNKHLGALFSSSQRMHVLAS